MDNMHDVWMNPGGLSQYVRTLGDNTGAGSSGGEGSAAQPAQDNQGAGGEGPLGLDRFRVLRENLSNNVEVQNAPPPVEATSGTITQPSGN